MRRTRAKATAPLRPPYIMTNWSTILSLCSRYWLAMNTSRNTPRILHEVFRLPVKGYHSVDNPGLHLYLKTVQKVMVRMTKAQFHSWSSWMVATPRNMKMIVSEELLFVYVLRRSLLWSTSHV